MRKKVVVALIYIVCFFLVLELAFLSFGITRAIFKDKGNGNSPEPLLVNSPENCLEIDYSYYCEEFFEGERGMNFCRTLGGRERDACFYKIAKFRDSQQICDKINEEGLRRECSRENEYRISF